ncbi:MAG: DUF2971 domain-containing protein [Spirochaetaceae bacterium]|nr:DUF2971 domain-containing protein [Spirochaetaceae bacterium]
MTYITIKDQRVDQIRCSSKKTDVSPGWIIVPDGFKGSHGDHIDWFTEDWIRIPDDKLIELGKRFDKRGRYYSKTAIGRVWDILYLDMDPGSDWTNLPPLENEPYQKFDEASGQWVIDIKNKSALENMSLMGHLDPYNKIEVPEFIYHYTSLDGFIKILDSKTFFMFNIYQMNDYKENVTIFDVLTRIISQKKSFIPDDYLKKLDEVFKNFDIAFTFVSCFTELRDSLSQWRSYGDDGNGICMIINPKNLGINYSLPSPNISSKCVSFHNVVYATEQQDKIIGEILDQAIRKNGAIDFANHVYELIARFAPIFKIKEFQEEKEWRIIYKTPLLEKETLGVLSLDSRHDIGFINTRNNLRSYFPLQIDKRKFIDSVTGIILGPKSIIPLMEISTLLNTKGYRNIEIRKSRISYR